MQVKDDAKIAIEVKLKDEELVDKRMEESGKFLIWSGKTRIAH